MRDPDAVISEVLRVWFEDSDEVQAVEKLKGDSFADRERVGYRFSIRFSIGSRGQGGVDAGAVLRLSSGHPRLTRLALMRG
jgi:hypothetical protein